jgi:hypothetical protein
MNYNDDRENRNYYPENRRRHEYRDPYHDNSQDSGNRYRSQESPDFSREPDYYSRKDTREDYYNLMYDTANYSGMPREEEYGLPYGTENDLDNIRSMQGPQEGPYSRQRHYSYNYGYNPNYDNPEEGDKYRDFDSRGNHGYRHDASYGTDDSFRDFGNDHYGNSDRSNDDRYRPY